MEQGREVPAQVAEGFLKGVDEDPKFLRFQERLFCVAQVKRMKEEQKAAVEALREERRALLVPEPRTVGLAVVFGLILLGLSHALSSLWAQAPLAVGLGAVTALLMDEVLHRRRAAKRNLRLAKIDDEVTAVKENAEEHVRALEARITEIDHEGASSIRIIDPATFGAPVKKEEKRSS